MAKKSAVLQKMEELESDDSVPRDQEGSVVSMDSFELARMYEFVVLHTGGECEFLARSVQFPQVVVADCVREDAIDEATHQVAAMIEVYREAGIPLPPLPIAIPGSGAGKRTEQVNIRLTAEERRVLSLLARRTQDCSGVPDLIRKIAIQEARLIGAVSSPAARPRSRANRRKELARKAAS